MTAAAPLPIAAEEFARRRKRVQEALGSGALVLAAGAPAAWAHDIEHRFRPDPDFFYLTGWTEPRAVLVLRGSAPAPFTLFVQAPDPGREAWTGPRLGPEAACAAFGADAAYPLSELGARLPGLLDGAETLFFPLWKNRALDGVVQRALADLAGRKRSGARAVRRLAWPAEIVHAMRLIKSPAEIALIEHAAAITAAGIVAGMARCRPGATEKQLQGAVEQAFLEAGAEGPGFPTIVAAGANACWLHYSATSAPVEGRDLVLIDAGASFCGYSGDLSRTFPASGRFTSDQRELYQVVLAAREKALSAVKPGATLVSVHEAAVEVLVAGLVEWGVLPGPPAAARESDEWRRYFPHRTAHWLGLDLHDVEPADPAGTVRTLEPGMVLTVEPGLYFPPADEKAPAAWRGLAVRLEDDLVVTPEGARVIPVPLPLEPEPLAALVGGSR